MEAKPDLPHAIRMKATNFYFQWSPDAPPRGFRTGVSLHSHTLHSKESLDFIYKIASHSSVLRYALRRGESRYRKFFDVPLDLRRGWWTPPLAPLDAYRVEAAQVASLGLRPIVSLTDHDDIEAPMSLQAIDPSREVPVSVEWTVPFGATFFHIGLHNLIAPSARATMRRLRELTDRPNPLRVQQVLAELNATPGVLTVFNHPLWDEKGVGADIHNDAVLEFLSRCGPSIHAIEVNGLRPWSENRIAIRLAREWRKPVISGGDRHAIEPNAVLNLTRAESFSEFVEEIRAGVSDVLVTSHYRQAHASRIVHNIADVLQPYENHGNGWREWQDRVFYHCPDDVVRSVRQLWGEGHPVAVRIFDGVMRLARKAPVRGAMRLASARAEQVGLES
jgi:hypothetical protein